MGSRLREERSLPAPDRRVFVIEWLAFPGMSPLTRSIARKTGGQAKEVHIHRFPDGESLVTLPDLEEGSELAIVATLLDPDPLALPLRFAAATARELGVGRVGLVAPYLAYMRQDQRFRPGQSISAPVFARFLDQTFDWIVTVAPHLHRIANLTEIFRNPAIDAGAVKPIADWISANVPDAVLFGPDVESRQWVSEVAHLTGRPFDVLDKVRHGDRDVEVSAPQQSDKFTGTPVIIDDIASSGRTMIRAVERLIEVHSTPPVCIVIHAAFSGSAYDDILAAGAIRVVSTDSIPHPSNAIPLAAALATAIASVTQEERFG